MPMNFTDAVSAYQKIARQDAVPGFEAPRQSKPGEFADVLREAAQGAVDTMYAGEAQALKAAAGAADLQDVVTAVGKAELTLQTVVTLRDRVIQAYQEVLRMPI